MTSYNFNGDKIWNQERHDWDANPMELTHDELVDANFYHTPEISVCGVVLRPVIVRGPHDEQYFSGWPGVGYSSAEFKMKAFQDAAGNIWRPSYAHGIEDKTGHQYAMTSRRWLVMVECEIYPACVKPVTVQP